MWIINTDTGKWELQRDTITKDYFDRLKEDMDSYRLWSKCLSGSTYLAINSLDNIYEKLKYQKSGFYIDATYSQVSFPNGPMIPIDNSLEYNKFLKEDAFSIKNLFTPTKLIEDQTNFVYVDVATTESIQINGNQPGLTIDDIVLLEGHRVLVKDQFSQVTLPITTDPETWFSTSYIVVEDLVTQITYSYPNEENGVYVWSNNKLIRSNELDQYDSSYNWSVSVKLGTINVGKQFALARNRSGYYPVLGGEFEFSEKTNWVLRNRVDYKNLYELNYFDILHHFSQVININGTYSIPERTIVVGEFGIIIDNQDHINSATWSVSHIMNNKYKVNLNSIAEVQNYYWICGDEGTILKVSKLDFNVEKMKLDETSNFTSISFYKDLNGIAVGKYNTIWTTNDGGWNWKKVIFDQFEGYSYNKVIQWDLNTAYVGGESGVFIELNWTNGEWVAYKRKIAKELNSIDEYILVEDINDMYKTTWNILKPGTWSSNSAIANFASNLKYYTSLGNNYNKLNITIDSPYFGLTTMDASEYYLAFKISNGNSTIYQNNNFTWSSGTASYPTWDIWHYGLTYSNSFSVNLPIDSEGSLVSGTYTISSNLVYNFDITGGTASVLPGYIIASHQFNINTINGRILLMAANNDNIIAYDIDSTLTKNGKQFIYLSSSQSHSDIKSIVRRKNSTEVYIAGDKIYQFYMRDFNNILDPNTNVSIGNTGLVSNLYVNKLFSAPGGLYMCGNNSLMQVLTYNSKKYTYDIWMQIISNTASTAFYNDSAASNDFYFNNISDIHYYNGIYSNSGQSKWNNIGIGDMFRAQFADTDKGLTGYSNRGINEIGGHTASSDEAYQHWKIQMEQHTLYELNSMGISANVNIVDSITQSNSYGIIKYVKLNVESSDLELDFIMLNSLAPLYSNSNVPEFDKYQGQVTNWVYSDLLKTDSVHKKIGLTSSVNGSLMDLDPTFLDNLRSRFLFLDYDIASKLTFFDTNREYRLPTSITFSTSIISNTTLEIDSKPNEYNWLSYYKDTEKTFRYYSSLSDSDSVKFSSNFNYSATQSVFTFSSTDITTTLSDIINFAPSLSSATASRFIQGSVAITGNSLSYNVYIYKYLILFKIPLIPMISVGDVLYLESNIIDCTLLVNRVDTWGSGSSQYSVIYCYSDFNQNIINNLKLDTITITNLNIYSSYTELLSRFELHPVSYGYKLIGDSSILELSARFNNLTAYYNMQTLANYATASSSIMNYSDSFLSFGYSPTYNLLDYLSNIDPIFVSSKRFVTLPRYYNIPGNNSNTFSSNMIYIDVNPIQGTNKIIFSKDLIFQWESLMIMTFVDIVCYSSLNSVLNERMLIINKYYDSDSNGYVMEFHKKIEIPTYGVGIIKFDILSRNTLGEISSDLQLLNNIQRSSLEKIVQPPLTFTNLSNDIFSDYNTDSYLKTLVSDFDIQRTITGIIYTDSDYNIALNMINLDENLEWDIIQTADYGGNLLISLLQPHNLKVGDWVSLSFTGGTASSEVLNPNYFGIQTVIDVSIAPNQFVTSKDFGVSILGVDSGKVKFTKKDPFLNYQPIDLFNLGIDKNVTRSIIIEPENYTYGPSYSLIDLDFNKYRFQLIDGLNLIDINDNYSWLLEAEIKDAIIGVDNNGPIWYSGTWNCGRWFGGTWISGRWVSGDWYDGIWKSNNTIYNITDVNVDNISINELASRWFSGRWFSGTWSGGTWYNGRRYSGDWLGGTWYNGIWNDGSWYAGRFLGGIWVSGTWYDGIFNCDNKPSYWLSGQFKSGDFQNGMWYDGFFGSSSGMSMFGTRASNSRTATWHGGKWIWGDFYSSQNLDSNGDPIASTIHKYSIWKTGTWYSGNWYGGIAYNIDLKSGNWYGGILEDIQVIGIGKLTPISSNTIILNGIFRFNIGDNISIIDNYSNGTYSPIGTNDNPGIYRINNVSIDLDNKQTYLVLNYDLSSLSIPIGGTVSNFDTGLRVVSHFTNAKWYSGIWTNGIFDSGNFYSGIWYNGIFNGTWGV